MVSGAAKEKLAFSPPLGGINPNAVHKKCSIIPLLRVHSQNHMQRALPLKRDDDQQETVQRRSGNVIRGLKNTTCGERLGELGLFSLEAMEGDVITALSYARSCSREKGINCSPRGWILGKGDLG